MKSRLIPWLTALVVLWGCGDPAGTTPGSGGSGAGTASGGSAGGGSGGTANAAAGGTAGSGNAGAVPGSGGVSGGSGGVSGFGGSSGFSNGGNGGSGGGFGGTGNAGFGGAGSGGTASGGSAGTGGAGTGGSGGNEFMVFLLIGQSNMAGVPMPQSQDRTTNERIKVLAYDNCSNLGRTYNQWYTAAPPLHGCYEGVGPGDYFARTLAEAFPEATIGLVPNAISGVDIDYFRKGVTSSRRNEFRIPPDNHWSTAYDYVIERARLAQEQGTIRGILFHQGESDNTSPQWLGKVEEMVDDLRADLGLGDVPFIAGELLYSGCCSAHNSIVNQLPGRITNAHVVSASGLNAMDQYHFDLAGQRELGRRYADKFLEAIGR